MQMRGSGFASRSSTSLILPSRRLIGNTEATQSPIKNGEKRRGDSYSELFMIYDLNGAYYFLESKRRLESVAVF